MSTMRLSTRLLRQALLSMCSFAINIALLFLFYTVFGISYLIAIPLTFLVTTAGNYLASRFFIFPETEQKMTRGFVLFSFLTLMYVICVTLSVAFLVEVYGIDVYVARIVVGFVLTGVGFFLNGRYNFRVI